MAVILHLESATTMCSVALSSDGKLLALEEINAEYTHAENLTSFVEIVLNRANISLKEIDAISVSKGPGSYTGLRIGVSAAKGLCFALDRPLIAINTLLAMSIALKDKFQDAKEKILFCPMLDARRMEVYCALIDREGNFVKETAADIIDENSFGEYLKEYKIIFFGDGADKCKVHITDANAQFLEGIVPSASNMIGLAEAAYSVSQFENTAYFEPFYLKDFVAGKKGKA